MIKQLLTIDTAIILVLLGCAYYFNSMICYGVAALVFVLDLIALVSFRSMLKNPENKA